MILCPGSLFTALTWRVPCAGGLLLVLSARVLAFLLSNGPVAAVTMAEFIFIVGFYFQHFVLPRFSAEPLQGVLSLEMETSHEVQADIICDGTLSSAFGGHRFSMEQIVKGDVELSITFSRTKAVR